MLGQLSAPDVAEFAQLKTERGVAPPAMAEGAEELRPPVLSQISSPRRRDFLARLGACGAAAVAPGLVAGTALTPARKPAELDFKVVRVTATAIDTEDTFDYGGVRKPSRGGGTYVEIETAGGLVGHG